MKAPTIGELNTRISFQSAIITADDAGGQSITWQPYRTVWGAVRSSRGSEVRVGEAVRARLRQHIVIRADDTIDATMRCMIEGVIYTILAVYRMHTALHWMVIEIERKEGV
jgi:SPP1 family predicted phage head-tail adaptor